MTATLTPPLQVTYFDRYPYADGDSCCVCVKTPRGRSCVCFSQEEPKVHDPTPNPEQGEGVREGGSFFRTTRAIRPVNAASYLI